MTRLFDRALPDEPATHAFVIGVGAYPYAQPGQGVPELQRVKPLPSAADSAKFMCDWLLKHRDDLAARLGSLEVLISDPPQAQGRYAWNPAKPVDPATEANVKTAGKHWIANLVQRKGDVALFYCCGHGASLSSQPVLFLEDLNADSANPWTHLNIGLLGQSLRQLSSIACAFLFVDACGEFVTAFQLARANDLRFLDAPRPNIAGVDKVQLLCAAPEALLAYEGAVQGNADLRLGRFTQTLVMALTGCSARWTNNRWTVHTSGLFSDLKQLRGVYFGHWQDNLPFEPSQVLSPNVNYSIVNPVDPILPVVISVDPEHVMANYDLYVSDKDTLTLPWSRKRDMRSPQAWIVSLPAERHLLFSIATDGASLKSSSFFLDRPIFDQMIPVQP